MVQTRAQAKGDKPGTGKSRNKRTGGNIDDTIQPAIDIKTKATATQQERSEGKKKNTNSEKPEDKNSNFATPPTGQDQKIQTLIEKHDSLPLSDTDLKDPTSSATPETILAPVLSAMLSSARISHEQAAKTTAEVIKAGYHNLENDKEVHLGGSAQRF
ncbi:hypothetical protein diail_11581 [Diaporthe ilicicola]|nr:hypothetical protein diail_11581 [Diaporthe ilicicola]